MKVGENIKEIREVEKNFKRGYMAERLNITARAYCNIENNVTDLSLGRLEQIAEILECSPFYILNYKKAKRDFYNYFHNHAGNNGINILNQGGNGRSDNFQSEMVMKLQQELLESEQQRIALLEALLKSNNINF